MHYYIYLLFFTISFSQISNYLVVNTQATGMAGAVVAEEGNSWSLFFNPAGISEIENSFISIEGSKLYSYNWLSYYNINGYFSLPVLGKVGLSFQQLETKYNKITLSSEETVSIGQAFNLQKDRNSHLAFGYTANFIQWNLSKSAGPSGDGSDGIALGNIHAFTIDFGILASLRNKYRFGAFVKNINSGSLGKGITQQTLPKIINVGITYLPTAGLSTSIVSERLIGEKDLNLKGSIKYILNPFIKIYIGAQTKPNRFGIGTEITSSNNQSISYSIITHPILPITHQLSIKITL
tara:strand:- start:656 stop:1537 length:882 start_codon:yes stop_codon:yes gene_type:complete